MKISVVIPFYNVEAYIERCLESLLAQSYPPDDLEIIMIDNNSNDGSADVVRRHPTVRLLSESRQGVYRARNQGVRQATGDVVAFTDPDCITAEDWLREIATGMRDENTQILLGERQLGRRTPALSLLEAYDSMKAAYTLTTKPVDYYFGYANNMAVRRELFDTVGPFEEIERGADTIFVQRVARKFSGDAVRYAPGLLIRHLEITSARDWYLKMYIYGKSSRNYSKLVDCKPLGFDDRMEIYKRVVERRGYSLLKGAAMLLLLVVGQAFFTLGRSMPS